MLKIGLSCLAALVAFSSLWLWQAAVADTPVHTEIEDAAQLTPDLVVFGQIPATSEGIKIVAENAIVKIVRDVRVHDISCAGSCPRDWNITDNVIRQVGFTTPRSGVSMISDALGSRAIVNGRVYALPVGKIASLQLGKDGVVVGGRKLDPIPGTEMQGTCEGQDSITVTVPESFSGSLTVGAANESQVTIGSWRGGNLSCIVVDTAKLSAGKLETLNKALLDVRNGWIDIADIQAKLLVTNINGKGTLDIKQGRADITNATVKGAGTITMKGNFRNLKQAVEGEGTIKVN